ncbi:MAG: glycosyltransferase family 2 protein, partial [Leptospiraceae bacterium]|nr:glycosyltransferase family 2 protein [Leptospiraceae bacterium]
MDCSVIICTYNRANILRENLLTLQQQAYDRGKLEILVVDNCSGDDTPAVARMFAKNVRYPVRYVYEARQGLSYARNCGFREARGEIVIFLDDDALPEKNTWVANLMKAFRDPQVCAAGGDIYLRWPDSVRPDWEHDF